MRRVLILIVSVIGVSILYLLRVNMSVAIIEMRDVFGWDNKTEGLVLSSFYYGYISTQLIGGHVADRIGGKYVFGLGLLWACFFTLIVPWVAQSVTLLVFARIMCGVGEGVTLPAINSLLAQWAPVSEKSIFISVMSSGGLAGTVIGMGFTPALINAFGWEYAFYTPFFVGVAWFVLWVLSSASYPEDLKKNFIWKNIDEKELDLIRENNPKSIITPGFPPLLSFFACRHVWAIICIHFTDNWGFYVLLSWLPSYMSRELDYNLSSAGLVSVLPFLAQFFGKVISGKLADILISKKILSPTNTRKLCQTIAAGGAGTFLLLLTLLSPSKFFVIVLIVSAVGIQGFEGGGFIVNHIDISPKYAGILLGITNTAGTIPGMVGVYFTGPILESWGWNAVWIIASIIYFIGLITFNIFSTAKRIDFDFPNGKWKYEKDYETEQSDLSLMSNDF